jgi:hypothetical protein
MKLIELPASKMYNERNRQNNWYVWYRVRAEKKDIFPI